MMASIAVVAFNHMRSAFSYYMKLLRQNIGKGIPIIYHRQRRWFEYAPSKGALAPGGPD
jgi:hypothetical protein